MSNGEGGPRGHKKLRPIHAITDMTAVNLGVVVRHIEIVQIVVILVGDTA